MTKIEMGDLAANDLRLRAGVIPAGMNPVAALAQHLHAVIAFMKVSQTWTQFYTMLNLAFPKRNDTLALPFMADSMT